MNSSQIAGVENPPHSKQMVLSVSARRWLLTLLVAFMPAIVSCLLVTAQGRSLTDFIPHWSDEVANWHQILTFKEVGFNGGYYTINELAPAADFTHYYTYGPWYPALYAFMARVIGWGFTSILVINGLLVGLALAVFCRVARLDERQMAVTALMLGTFWGLLLYFFTGMQEAFQQTLAILLAAVFVLALRQREQLDWRYRLLGFALVAFAALMRLSWAILFLPFLLLTSRGGLARWLLWAAVSLFATGAIMLLASFTGAPGNNSIFDMIAAFQVSIGAGLDYFVRYFGRNLARFLFLPKTGTDVLQTYQVVIFILGLMVVVGVLITRQRKRRSDAALAEAAFHLFNIGGTLTAACALYLIGTGGDYRLLATHLMLSLLLLITFKRYRPALLLVATNVLFLPIFWSDFRTVVTDKYTPDHSAYITFKATADAYLTYDAQAPSAWCNTLLFHVSDYDRPMLTGVPAGIGLSFFKDPNNPMLSFKSRYLLLSAENYRLIAQRPDAPQLEWLADVPTARLYVNRSADCSSPESS